MRGALGRQFVRRGHRQGEREGAPLADAALDSDRAPMRFDDCLHDRQAEANATSVLRVALPELLEDVWQAFRWNPRSGVAHPERRGAVLDRRLECDAAARLRELDGVA